VRAALIFNGHTQDTINALDEATMHSIMVMYADGALGNKSVAVGLGTLTAGVFNYLRASNSQTYKLKDILGATYQYYYNEPEVSASESLLTFMSQAQGFNVNKFKR
jgi:hypothetical protein